jgi:hypothetical protein
LRGTWPQQLAGYVNPPSLTTEFSQWVGYFRDFSCTGQRTEQNRLRRLRATLEIACEGEEDYEEEDDEEDYVTGALLWGKVGTIQVTRCPGTQE